MANPIVLVAGDTAVELEVPITRTDTNAAFDLTGCTATLRFKCGNQSVIERGMTILSPATLGICYYIFEANELQAGPFEGEVVVTNGSGGIVTSTLINLTVRSIVH